MRSIKVTTVACLALLSVSCNQESAQRTERQRDSLLTVLREREAGMQEQENSLNEFIESFNEVERNLDCVAVRQQLIYSSAEKSRGELKGTQRDKINAQIAAINELMDKNRQTIADLQRKLRNSGSRNNKLEKTVATLQAQLEQKDNELAALNQKLNELNLKVNQLQTALDSANALSQSQSKTIAENLAAMHTAYYLVGRSKELREAKVIDRTGGLLGIGKTSRLNEDFDQSKFTRINYTETTTIPVNAKQTRMVTNHPPDSYKMNRSADDRNLITSLVITDPERFWSVSKFLVIEGNPAR